MSNEQAWNVLEQKIISVARVGKANKQSAIEIDDDVALPAKIKPWPKIESTNCGQNTKPWPKIDCSQTTAVICENQNAAVKYEVDSDVMPLIRAAPNRQETNKQEIAIIEEQQTATTVSQQVPWRWQKGQSGNPAGRKPGSKHKITELARSIVIADFEQHGAKTLERVRVIDPVSYLRLVMHFVPKELLIARERGHCTDLGDLTDEEFIEILEAARKRNTYKKIMESDARLVAEGKL